MTTVSKEQENGFRLQLTRELIEENLRQKFHTFFPHDPTALYNALKAFEKLFQKLLKKKVLRIEQYQLILPLNCMTYSVKFDSTLLIFLLRQEELSGFIEPATGWYDEPLGTDRSDSANLIRFRIGRNKMQHFPLKVSDTKFTEIFGPLKQALQEYGCSITELNIILTSCLDQKEKQRADHLENCLQGVTYKLTPTCYNFVGREEEVAEIYKQLASLPPQKLGLAICGMPGLGKTELARHYCNRYLKDYDNNVLWINAESHSTMESSFQDIADFIKLDIKDSKGRLVSIDVIVHRIYHYFAGRKVLLTFDNVQDVEAIETFLPVSNPAIKSTILFTSQNQKYGNAIGEYHLNVFTSKDSNTFICKNSGKNIQATADELKTVSNLLGNHPLALSHAVAYTLMNQITYSKYIELYRSQAAKLLLDSFKNNLRNDTVMTTFQLALQKIKQVADSTSLIKLLNIMAHIDGKEIKKGFLLEFFDNDELELNKALKLIRNYSLITIPEVSTLQSFNEQINTIHSLVKLSIQEEQTQSGIQEKVIEEIFEVFLRDANEGSGAYFKDTGRYWWNHLIYIINESKHQTLILELVEKHIAFFYAVLQRKYKFNELIHILKRLINVQQNRSKEESLNMRSWLGDCLKDNGDLTEAIALYRKVLHTQSNLLPGYHEDVLATQHNLALCLSDNGNRAEAIEMFQKVLNIQSTTLPKNQYNVLATQNNLALCLKENGNLEEAIEIFKNVLNIQSKALPEDHVSVLAAQHNLALCLKDNGNIAKAIELFQNVLKVGSTILPEDHLNVLETQNNLALCLKENGNLEEAIEIFKNVLNIRSKILPKDHVSVYATLCNLSVSLMENGDLKDALETIRKVEEYQIRMNNSSVSRNKNFPAKELREEIERKLKRNQKTKVCIII